MFKNLLVKNKASFLLLLYFGVMPVLMGSFVSGMAIKHMEQIRNSDTVTIFAVNLLVSVFLALGFIPTTFYSLLCGYIFGWGSLQLILISYAIACALGYIICSKIDNGGLLNALEEKYNIGSVKIKLESSGFWIPAMCRLSPALPFAIMNAVFAIVKFPFVKYMIGSMIGMMPRTLFAVFIGMGFTKIHSVEDMKSEWSLWFAIVLAIISFGGIGWIIKKKLA